MNQQALEAARKRVREQIGEDLSTNVYTTSDTIIDIAIEAYLSACAKNAQTAATTLPPGAEGELSCDDQFALATKLAANIGYVLRPEPEIETDPTRLPKFVRAEDYAALSTTIEALKEERDEARETNRRLNRRIGELLSDIANDRHFLETVEPAGIANSELAPWDRQSWSFRRDAAMLAFHKESIAYRKRAEALESSLAEAQLHIVRLEEEVRSAASPRLGRRGTPLFHALRTIVDSAAPETQFEMSDFRLAARAAGVRSPGLVHNVVGWLVKSGRLERRARGKFKTAARRALSETKETT